MPIFNLSISNHDTRTAIEFYDKHALIFAAAAFDLTDRKRWKIFSAAASISQIYAAFERSFSDIVKDYILFIQSKHPEIAFPESTTDAYRKSVALLLSRLNWERYGDVSEIDVISSYLNYLNKKGSNRIHPEAILVRDQNLRFETILEILNRMGVSRFESWLTHAEEVKSLYPEGDSVLDSLKSDWKNLIEWRNDAAHGVLDDDLPGVDLIRDYADMVCIMCSALSEYLTHSLINSDSANTVFEKIGIITEYFAKPDAAILLIELGKSVSVGDKLILSTKNSCKTYEVKSLQLDSIDVENIPVDPTKVEAGIKVEAGVKFEIGKPKKGSSVYRLKP